MNQSAGQLARGINILAGVWLFISAFVLPHESAMFTNTWILGILAVIFAITAMRYPAVRYLNTLLAIWLFISAFALPHVNNVPVWNNAIVAIVIFVISLIPQARTAAIGSTDSQRAPEESQRHIQPPQQPQTV
jgi:SPW repeat-containing protein